MKTDLQDRRTLQIDQHAADAFETHVDIAADMNFRLRDLDGLHLQAFEQVVVGADRRVIPIDVALACPPRG